MNKRIKKSLEAIIVIGFGVIIYYMITSKSTPSLGYDENADTIDMYDDKEYYHLTHDENGDLNEYGKSLG